MIYQLPDFCRLKKLFAIFLVNIHLFSLCGQLILREYKAYQSNKFYTEQTAKGRYNVNDLTEVIIPVQLNSVSEWGSYENISGQIQFEDNTYNYVKMKITHHAMYLMCVPNYESTQPFGNNIITAKNVKNVPVPKKDHVPFGKSVPLSDLQYVYIDFAFSSPFKELKIKTIPAVHQLPYLLLEIPEQPPKSFC